MILALNDTLSRIALPMPFRLRHVHAYLLTTADGLVLVDTGMDTPDSFAALEAALAASGKHIADIQEILVTHHHIDHAGMAGRIARRSGATVRMTEASCAAFRRDLDISEERRKAFFAFYHLLGWDDPAIDETIAILQRFKETIAPLDGVAVLPLENRHVYGDVVVEVHATPGHTRGHAAFFLPSSGILLAGDHILPRILPNLSPDLSEPSFYPLTAYLDSLERLCRLPVSLVCPGHGDPFDDLAAQAQDVRERHLGRSRRAVEALQNHPCTVAEVVHRIYAGRLHRFDAFLALNETYIRLVEAARDGEIGQCWRNGRLCFQPA